MTKEAYLKKAVKWVNTKAPNSFRSILEGYDDPIKYMSKATQEEFQADLSFVSRDGIKHYYVLALKDENPQKTVDKWEILSFIASMKKGQLHLLTPNGHKAFTEKIVNDHHIKAVIHPI